MLAQFNWHYTNYLETEINLRINQNQSTYYCVLNGLSHVKQFVMEHICIYDNLLTIFYNRYAPSKFGISNAMPSPLHISLVNVSSVRNGSVQKSLLNSSYDTNGGTDSSFDKELSMVDSETIEVRE